jgi:urease accessory protein
MQPSLSAADAAREHRAGAEPVPPPYAPAPPACEPRQLDLTFAATADGRTVLRRQHVTYPFHVGRSWTVAGDPDGMLTLYVQSCSGGVFQHDDLGLRITTGPGAHAHVTTAAATIVHRMDNGHARQSVTLEAQPSSLLEYLPDPLILFRGARLRNELTLRAHPQAVVMAWDAIVPHDPDGSGGAFDWIASELCVQDLAGRVLARDRYRLNGTLLARRLPGVTGPFQCQGAFLVVQRQVPQATLVEALRAALPAKQGLHAGASSLPWDCGAWVRVLAADALLLRDALQCAWYSARRLITGTQPRPRRK